MRAVAYVGESDANYPYSKFSSKPRLCSAGFGFFAVIMLPFLLSPRDQENFVVISFVIQFRSADTTKH